MTRGNSQKLQAAGWNNGLDHQINALVHDLCALAPAEIKIVEEI